MANPPPARAGKAASKPSEAKATAAAVEIPPPPMKAEIRARLRKGRPSRFVVAATGALLGRDDEAAVAIPLDGVSREHARILWNGKGWWIEDLKSTNGTFLNGERIARESLNHLDVIGLGRNADVVFVLRDPEAAAMVRKGILRAALVESDGAIHEIPVGEFTLGRSVACNVVASETAVSKVHARIERSSEQLLIEDLSSSNGTFVNGARVRTAVLWENDTVDLAGVAKFKVVIEQGEVTGSGVFRAPTLAAKEDAPRFSAEWKTRFEWNPEELAGIAAAVAGVRPPELDREREASVPKQARAAKAGPAAPAPASAAGPIRSARLTGEPFSFTLSEPGRYELGQGASASFRIDHSTVSPRHAALTLSADRMRLSVEDLGAANRTQVNGAEIEQPHVLADGDVIGLGEVRLSVRLARA